MLHGGRACPCNDSSVGTFDTHTDFYELQALKGEHGLEAIGLWQSCGARTSRNGRTGFVPDDVVKEMRGTEEAIACLVGAGVWERRAEGYAMLCGPTTDPDDPLPLWRYGDEDLGGRLFAMDDTPNN